MYVNYPLWNRTPRLDFGFAELEAARQEAIDRLAGVEHAIHELNRRQFATWQIVEQMQAQIAGIFQTVEAEQRRVRDAIKAMPFLALRESVNSVPSMPPAPAAPITPQSFSRRRRRGSLHRRLMRLEAKVNEHEATLQWWEARWFLSQLEPPHPEDDAALD